jgi:hypothetical protein
MAANPRLTNKTVPPFIQPAESDDVDGLSSTASKCQSVVARIATTRETVRGKVYQNWR